MNASLRILRRYPIEVFVLGIPAVFLIVWGSIYRIFFLSDSGLGTIFTTFAGESIGGVWFYMAFTVVICWLIYKTGEIINLFYKAKNKKPLRRQIIELWKSAGYILGITALSSIAVALSITVLFHTASASRTIYFSKIISEWEYYIFGTYPHFAIVHFFEQFPSLDYFIVNGYNGLFVCISFAFLFAFLKSIKVFRRFVLAFFITFGISLPVWFLLPMVAPLEFHVDNVFKLSQPPSVQSAVAVFEAEPPLPDSALYRSQLEKLWIAPNGDWLAVSCLPSMHAAWALIMIVTLFSLDTLVGLIFLPAFVFCIIGTVYTLNHYISDVVIGLLVGLIALWIAERLLRYEKTYRETNGDFFLAALLMQKDVQRVWREIKKRIWV